jgi:hypothetical protein
LQFETLITQPLSQVTVPLGFEPIVALEQVG